jgi:hypothetical protein
MSTAEERDIMRGFTKQLVELTGEVHGLDVHLATIDQWAKNADEDIDNHGKTLYGNNGNDGLEMKVDRLNSRVGLVFAVGGGAWALVTILFSIIAANLVDKFAQLAAAIK